MEIRPYSKFTNQPKTPKTNTPICNFGKRPPLAPCATRSVELQLEIVTDTRSGSTCVVHCSIQHSFPTAPHDRPFDPMIPLSPPVPHFRPRGLWIGSLSLVYRMVLRAHLNSKKSPRAPTGATPLTMAVGPRPKRTGLRFTTRLPLMAGKFYETTQRMPCSCPEWSATGTWWVNGSHRYRKFATGATRDLEAHR